MRETLVLTVLGPDRTGLVQALADRIAAAGGNWEASHMTRLAGQFAGIVLVTAEPDQADRVRSALRGLDDLEISFRMSAVPAAAPGERVKLQLTGDDRPGIVRDVARVLAERGVNVEQLASSVSSAPMSGDPLFTARAVLHLPPTMTLADVRSGLESLSSELMVDLDPE
jgi:glycine cleavage system regulatory protein